MVSFKLLTALNEHIIYHNTTIISSVKMKWNMQIKQNLKVTKNDFYYITEKTKVFSVVSITQLQTWRYVHVPTSNN